MQSARFVARVPVARVWAAGCLLPLLLLSLALSPAAVAEPPGLAPEAERADRVVVRKAERRLTLYRGGIELASYDIALGREPNTKER